MAAVEKHPPEPSRDRSQPNSPEPDTTGERSVRTDPRQPRSTDEPRRPTSRDEQGGEGE